MPEEFNIYVDESCHLQNDRSSAMCIGYIKIKTSEYGELKDRLKAIKLKHKSPTEIKWNKISWSRFDLYKDLIDFFFSGPLEFRCILVKNKHRLDHDQFNQGDPDNFYYKTVYLLLNASVNPASNVYRVFLDIKDTRGKERLRKINDVFNNKHKGISPFNHFQHIHSHENEFLQLVDLFIGAVTYKSRQKAFGTTSSEVKLEVIKYIESVSGYQLDEGSEPWEKKFNIFDFQPKSRS